MVVKACAQRIEQRIFGSRVHPPLSVARALERIFGESIVHVEVFEASTYARWHAGARATTRRNRIFLSCSAAQFWADPELVLHEYFHVIRQWQPRRLTRFAYAAELVRNGYWMNRFEIEARQFAVDHRAILRELLVRDDLTLLNDRAFPRPQARC